jgi:diadenylate cyclase
MAVKAGGRSNRNVVQLVRPTLRETISRLAPGTALRDGLERILRGRTGALILIGYDDSVEAICDGGFVLDVRYAPTRLRELSKMDGAVVLSSDGSRILRANVQLVPDPSIATEESGTRHRSAERAAIQTGYPVISVSHSMSIVTVYVAGERHVIPDSATILSRTNQTIDTLERYKTRLDEVHRQLSTAEIEDFVTLRDVMTVAQRLEMVRRISLEIDSDVVELGTDGRQLKLQLEELVGDNDTARELIVRDYHANRRAGERHPRGARRSLGQRAARLHYAGKGFRLPVDAGGAGFGDELARLPRDGRNPAAAVRPRRPAGPVVRVVAGATGGKRK